MQQPSLRSLLPAVHEAARMALGYYRGERRLDVDVKRDASLVTAADRAVEVLLRAEIERLFPDARVIGEEGGGGADFEARREARFTFAVDPIDGTEPFASRNPGWCISIGVLDAALRPVGGIVHVPAWDTLFFADLDPAAPALANDELLAPLPVGLPRELDDRTVMLVDSKAHQRYRYDGFTGRCRGYGSAALHGCLVAARRGAVAGQLLAPFVWDIAGAHAIGLRVGMAIQHMDGTPLDYAPMIGGGRARDDVLMGHPDTIAAIAPCFVRTC